MIKRNLRDITIKILSYCINPREFDRTLKTRIHIFAHVNSKIPLFLQEIVIIPFFVYFESILQLFSHNNFEFNEYFLKRSKQLTLTSLIPGFFSFFCSLVSCAYISVGVLITETIRSKLKSE